MKSACFIAWLSCLVSLPLWSMTPVPYSGKVAINTVNFHGNAEFTFSLHDGNGTSHWRNGADANQSIQVFVNNGRYSVLLGGQGMNTLPAELFLNHDKLYLKVEFDNGDGAGLRHLAPDQLITATPRALVAEWAKMARLAEGVSAGSITRDMLSHQVLTQLDANGSSSTVGPITRDMLPASVLNDLNKTIVITRDMLPQDVQDDLNQSIVITRDMLPQDVQDDLNRTVVITRQMLPADVLNDLNHSISAGSISFDMLAPEVRSDLNRTITKSMLGSDVLADLNKTVTITRDMLPQNVRNDLNKTITYDRLAPSALDAIFSASLASITAGKIKIVSFRQTPPNGYSLYHRGKAENLIWKFTPSSPSPGATFDKTIFYNNRVITMGKENGFQQNPVLSTWTNFYSVNNSIGQYSTALLSNNVYLIGGHDGNSKSNRLRIFNLINSSFSEAAPTPVAAQHKTAQALNGKIFETGGWKSGNGGSRRTFCYDPVLDKWTEKSLTNFGRIHSASIVYQNKMWIIGGENNSADKVESYDTTNDNWTVEKSLLKGRKQASCWVFEDYLFVGGGKDVNGTILDSIECYDPRTETWYNWGQLPNPVTGCAAFVVGDLLHIFDGVGNAGVLTLDLNKSVSNLNDIYIQDGNASAGTPLVQAEVADGSVTTAKLDSTILKYLKPEITSQPQVQTVYAGSNVSFSVAAEGKYLTYQWKKDGADLTGETNATINIVDTNSTNHDGNYSVVVSNDFGSVESGLVEVLISDSLLNGLVGWWKFDESNGTVAYDSSGNGNDGSLTNGPTWVSGKLGGALSFDGVNDYFSVSQDFFNNKSFSLSIWVKNSLNNNVILIHGTVHDTNRNLHLQFRESGNKGLTFAFYSNDLESTFSGLLDWGMFTFTFDNTNKLRVAYANGNQVSLDTSPSPYYGNGNLIIGRNSVTGSMYYTEITDDLRIYDRALSAAEVQALYNLGQ